MAIDIGKAVAYLELDTTAFNSALDQANSALGTLTDSSSTLGDKLTATGGAITNTGNALTKSLTVPIMEVAKESVSFGMDFDKAMSQVQSVSYATGEEFEDLRELAIEMGRGTVYTAEDAANALYYMGLAGWDVNESMSGLPPLLNLAAAGQLDLGTTSDILTDAMTALHLSADGMSEGLNSAEWFANVLAVTMSHSNTTVDKLGESFKYVAPVIGGLETPLYTAEQATVDTTFALGLLADSGIKSSQAGTTLRRVLINLMNPSETVQSGFEALGFTTEELNVSENGLKGTLDLLRGAVQENIPYLDETALKHLEITEGLSDEEAEMALYNQMQEMVEDGTISLTQQETIAALARISGAYAVSGMIAMMTREQDEYDALYDAIGNANEMYVRHGDEILTITEAYEKYGDQIYDTSGEFEILGAAEGMAEIQTDNLWGKWVEFTSALDTAKITISDIVKEHLSKFVEKLTDLVNAFIDLDPEMKEHIIKIGLIAAAIGPLLVIIGTVITHIGQVISTLQLLGGGIGNVITHLANFATHLGTGSGALGTLGKAFGTILSNPFLTGAFAVGIAAVIAAIIDLWNNNESFREDVTRIWEAIVKLIKGVWTALEPVFKTLIEVFGKIVKALEPIIEVLVAVLTPIIEGIIAFLIPLIDMLAQIITVILDIVGAIIDFLSPVLESVILFVGSIIEVVAGFIGFILEGIGSLLQGIVDWGKKISDLWRALWQGIVDVWNAIFAPIIDVLRSALNGIKEAFEWLKYVLIGDPIVTDMWQGIADIFGTFIDFVTGIVDGFVEGIKKFFGFLKEHVIDKVKELADGAKEKFQHFVDDTKEKFDKAKEHIVEWGTNIVNKTREKLQEFHDNAKEKFNAVKDKVSEFKTEATQHISTWCSDVKEKSSEAMRKFKENITSKTDETKRNFTTWFSEVNRKFDTFKSDMSRAGTNAMSNFMSSLKSKFSELSNWFSGALNGLKNSASNTWDNIKNAANTMISGIGTAISGIKSKISGSHADGLSYVPFDGYIAELHRGERVLTAEENRRYSSGSSVGGATINFYSNERINEYTAARELRRTIHDIELGLV